MSDLQSPYDPLEFLAFNREEKSIIEETYLTDGIGCQSAASDKRIVIINNCNKDEGEYFLLELRYLLRFLDNNGESKISLRIYNASSSEMLSNPTMSLYNVEEHFKLYLMRNHILWFTNSKSSNTKVCHIMIVDDNLNTGSLKADFLPNSIYKVTTESLENLAINAYACHQSAKEFLAQDFGLGMLIGFNNLRTFKEVVNRRLEVKNDVDFGASTSFAVSTLERQGNFYRHASTSDDPEICASLFLYSPRMYELMKSGSSFRSGLINHQNRIDELKSFLEKRGDSFTDCDCPSKILVPLLTYLIRTSDNLATKYPSFSEKILNLLEKISPRDTLTAQRLANGIKYKTLNQNTESLINKIVTLSDVEVYVRDSGLSLRWIFHCMTLDVKEFSLWWESFTDYRSLRSEILSMPAVQSSVFKEQITDMLTGLEKMRSTPFLKSWVCRYLISILKLKEELSSSMSSPSAKDLSLSEVDLVVGVKTYAESFCTWCLKSMPSDPEDFEKEASAREKSFASSYLYDDKEDTYSNRIFGLTVEFRTFFLEKERYFTNLAMEAILRLEQEDLTSAEASYRSLINEYRLQPDSYATKCLEASTFLGRVYDKNFSFEGDLRIKFYKTFMEFVYENSGFIVFCFKKYLDASSQLSLLQGNLVSFVEDVKARFADKNNIN